MENVKEVLPLLEVLIKGIAAHFGSRCEVVVHDYSKGFDQSIVSIVNGNVTGRSVGDSGSSYGLRVVEGVTTEDGTFKYMTQTTDGRRLLSSTIYLKNDENKVVGSVCLNYDVTELLGAKNLIDQFLNVQQGSSMEELTTVTGNVEEMLVSLINDSFNVVGVAVANMTREQKKEGILYLKKKGAFKIKNAAVVIAKYYDVSKFTVYNYINEEQA